MPPTPHHEAHFKASATVRDVVIGMADGLTVPFALAAGISGAVGANEIVVAAGLAEIAAGSIAMGLGGYLAAQTDAEHYANERRREYQEVETLEGRERAETAEILAEYGLSGETLKRAVDAIASDKDRWVDFMMRFELGLEAPDKGRALASAATIGGAYIVGGMIPLSPYIITGSVDTALPWSIGATAIALVVFGAVKARLTGISPVKGAGQTLLVGGLAAAVAYLVAGLFT